MPKAKKKSKKRSTHRRRMGATASLNAASPVVKIGALAVGYFFGEQINAAIDKVAGTMDEKLKGAAEGGIGAALIFMKLGKTKPGLLQVGAGGILAGAGARRLLKAFGVINGFSAVPVIGNKMLPASQRRLNGYGNVPVVAGYNVPQQMNGVFNGYNVPPVPKAQVMGSVAGSGLMDNGGSYMN